LKKRVPELLHRVEELHEFNPMLGLRGCRLGILYPEITEMQARAIFEAVVVAAKKGVKVIPEVMIPLIGSVKELENQKAIVVKVAEEVLGKAGMKDQKYMVGTMIEIPRAALTADQVATEAEFFSFGTNDLTQTTLGISRDDYVRFSKIYGARRRRRPSRPTNRKRCARRRRRCKLLFCHRPVPQGAGRWCLGHCRSRRFVQNLFWDYPAIGSMLVPCGPHNVGNEASKRFQGLLIEARKRAGLTQYELAARLKRPQSFVSKFERGERRLDVLEFREVAQALGIDPIRFLRRLYREAP
jgi:hypothetical protein